jgi:tRNA(Ile)-lysidine synthase
MEGWLLNFTRLSGLVMNQVIKQRSPTLLWSVEKFITEYGLLEPGDRVLIGVSGGPDSMALFSLLGELRPKWGWDLSVLYCHHGLRSAADIEESFVRTWSKKLDCLYFSRRLPVREYQKETGKSLQEAARELRYRSFEDLVKQEAFDRVALAHTANDQAEEVLIGLIRGAGLGGLTGMPIQRGPFIRPFLQTSRREILNYLASKNIPYKEDASNKDFHYLRVRVRHHLLGELKQYSPNIVNQLNQTARLLKEDEDYLQEKAAQLFDTVASYSGQTALLHRHNLGTLPQSLASRIIQKVLLESLGHLRHVRSVHILSILKAARYPGEQGGIPLPGGWVAQWDREAIKILPAVSDPKIGVPFSYEVERPQRLSVPEINGFVSFRKVEASTNFFQPSNHRNLARVDFDKVSWPLVIRNIRPGDRFQPLGLKGSKKVGRFFIDRKVPLELRSRIPLVFSRGEIVWVAGMEIGHPFSLELHSTRVLEMAYGTEKEG